MKRVTYWLVLSVLALAVSSAHAQILFGVPVSFSLQGDGQSKTFQFNLSSVVAVNQSGFTLVDFTASPASIHSTACTMPQAGPVITPVWSQSTPNPVPTANGMPTSFAPTTGGYVNVTNASLPNLPANVVPGSGAWQFGGNDGTSLPTYFIYTYTTSYAPTASLNGSNVVMKFNYALPPTMFSGDPTNPLMPSICMESLTVLYAGH